MFSIRNQLNSDEQVTRKSSIDRASISALDFYPISDGRRRTIVQNSERDATLYIRAVAPRHDLRDTGG
jgi:hypothetical protein